MGYICISHQRRERQMWPFGSISSSCKKNLSRWRNGSWLGTLRVDSSLTHLSDRRASCVYAITIMDGVSSCSQHQSGGLTLLPIAYRNLRVVQSLLPIGVQVFMVSKNAVFMCDVERIQLYHTPELSSAEGSLILCPCWEWLAGSK